MSTQDSSAAFREDVASRLTSPGSKELWYAVAEELGRTGGGPNAAEEYLNAQRQAFESRVQNALDEAEGALEG